MMFLGSNSVRRLNTTGLNIKKLFLRRLRSGQIAEVFDPEETFQPSLQVRLTGRPQQQALVRAKIT